MPDLDLFPVAFFGFLVVLPASLRSPFLDETFITVPDTDILCSMLFDIFRSPGELELDDEWAISFLFGNLFTTVFSDAVDATAFFFFRRG